MKKTVLELAVLLLALGEVGIIGAVAEGLLSLLPGAVVGLLLALALCRGYGLILRAERRALRRARSATRKAACAAPGVGPVCHSSDTAALQPMPHTAHPAPLRVA